MYDKVNKLLVGKRSTNTTSKVIFRLTAKWTGDEVEKDGVHVKPCVE
jgi:hypothetical protein